jgi:hypothetical protein
VPAADIDARTGWLREGGAVLKDSDPESAASLGTGLERLSGTVALDTRGTTITVSMPWKGWKARLDGKPIALNKPYFVAGNFRRIELEGRAPAGAKGGFPGAVMVGPTRIRPLAWRFERGLDVAWIRGMKPDWDRKADYHSTLLDPVLRFAEDYRLVDYPAQIRVTATFTPPTDGEWHLRLRYPGAGPGKVFLKGTVAVPNPEGGPGSEVMGTLKAGVPLPLRVNYEMQLSHAPATAFLLETKAPGDTAWHWIDAHTLRPPQ